MTFSYLYITRAQILVIYIVINKKDYIYLIFFITFFFGYFFLSCFLLSVFFQTEIFSQKIKFFQNSLLKFTTGTKIKSRQKTQTSKSEKPINLAINRK